jgi:hypothetical protein
MYTDLCGSSEIQVRQLLAACVAAAHAKYVLALLLAVGSFGHGKVSKFVFL